MEEQEAGYLSSLFITAGVCSRLSLTSDCLTFVIFYTITTLLAPLTQMSCVTLAAGYLQSVVTFT